MSQMPQSQQLSDPAVSGPIGWAEMGIVPDSVIRAGIRRLNRQRLSEICASDPESAAVELAHFVNRMNTSEIAPLPELANDQHYEVPAEFFGLVMGEHRKYSSCYWKDSAQTLDEAEETALAITCEHAQIKNGMRVLDLGCGVGRHSWLLAREGFNVTGTDDSPTAVDLRYASTIATRGRRRRFRLAQHLIRWRTWRSVQAVCWTHTASSARTSSDGRWAA